ncbi:MULTISPECIES: (2,3-dihydroxybenzoyl)adenylate synthase [unclassified Saccharopolyspora]|uniref:(2,3-dihydroxybenzoyl)adenylate synthase n=1 Tax=unclassified Saccharopolyspora TaxID=2646250 RepID=UPI001CD37EB3|nr:MULTISPECIES: AMP-binding protein [unclassified Saccharopolyspora]MCA1184969.1 AMP-binding protein [Saccharopolyspora sp. 6T]MCA1190691.1 AMP-binding protein [Saccharopolyspora sp. 6V]
MAPLEGTTGWPADFAARYREAGYWAGRTLGGLLRDSARRAPERTALVDGDRRWDYRELDDAADRVAAGLRAHGIAPGDRVLVHLPNVAEFAALLFGCARAGAVPVLALPPHRETELVHLAELAGAVAYAIPAEHGGFDHLPLAEAVTAGAPSVRHVFVVGGDPGRFTPFDALTAAEPGDRADDAVPEDVAVLLLSGGTTGLPKLIPRTHDDYAYNALASAEISGLDAASVYLAALPAAHNFALACPGLLGAFAVGATVVLSPGGDPETAFPLIERERVTVVALVPPLVLVWLDAAELFRPDLSSLRLLQAGGSRLKDDPARRVRSVLGCALQQVYGMAEGLLNFTRLDDLDELVIGTQGRPLSADDEVLVCDQDGDPVPDGQVGELLVRGPYTLRGYFRAEAHNERSFTADGFFRTGDLVRRLPTGHLVVEGRSKEVINRGGDKIPVEEVENHLLSHPAVHDVALVGFPDEAMGERSCAFVLAAGEPPNRRDLVEHLRRLGVAAFKLPDRVRVLESFPRTGLGKVDRRALAEGLVRP